MDPKLTNDASVNFSLQHRGGVGGGREPEETRPEQAIARGDGTTRILPHGDGDRAFPLSYAQERLWFIENAGIAGAAYNMVLAVRLFGIFDVGAMEQCIGELTKRHEILRTRYVADGAEARQVVDSWVPPTVRHFDASTPYDSEQAEDRLLQLIEEEQLKAFALSDEWSMRTVIVRMGDLCHALVITIHHIASDGWSMGVLMRDLSTMYAEHVGGATTPLPHLEVQYADYSRWQRSGAEAALIETQMQYWRERFQGAPMQLRLPTDRRRPQIESFNGATIRFAIERSVYLALREIAKRLHVTIYMIAVAAFQHLLSRWSGQDDVVVGTTIAGRSKSEVENLIGFFVNALPLRIQTSAAHTFRDVIECVRTVALEAYEHQDVPFDRLVKELRPERSIAHQPLFQVSVSHQSVAEKNLAIPGVTMEHVEFEYRTTRYDLTLHLFEGVDNTNCILQYSTALFDKATVERVASHYLAILGEAARNPDVRLNDIALIGEQERRKLLLLWNQTEDCSDKSTTVHGSFVQQVAKRPEATALIWKGGSLTYAELEAQANRLAHYLRSMGVRPEVVVGLCMERSPEMVVALLAILKAGGAYLPLEPALPVQRLKEMTVTAGCRWILTQHALVERLKECNAQIVATDWEDVSCYPSACPLMLEHSGTLAYVIFTSGSTGYPKGVMVEHASVLNYLSWALPSYLGEWSDPIPIISTIAFDATATALFCALLGGRPAMLLKDGAEIDELLELLEGGHRCSLVKLAPAHLQALAPHLDSFRQYQGIETMVVGGEALPSAMSKLWKSRWPGMRIVNQYGPTETTIACTSHVIAQMSDVMEMEPIGRPGCNVRLYVLDERLQLVPIGMSGELYVSGRQVSRGYINRSDSTAERYVANPFSELGERMYRTGDYVRYRADGVLEFLGRADDQIKIRGFRVELGEIERVLRSDARVRNAVVLASAESGETRLTAYIVPQSREEASAMIEIEEDGSEDDSLAEWQVVHNSTYGTGARIGPSFVGWISSYTGSPIDDEEMDEWLNNTVSRIMELAPRRVLEIGCGVGLLLEKIAPEAEYYLGTDFSGAAIQQLRHWVGGRQELGHVELLECSAERISECVRQKFDLVIINSVVQYFPGAKYLQKVMDDAVGLVNAGGNVFIGDVRNLRSLSLFHSAVQLQRAAASVTVSVLRQRIERSIRHEKELVIDPDFFLEFSRHNGSVNGTRVLTKRGRASNELSRHRYDVVLSVGPVSKQAPNYQYVTWGSEIKSIPDLQSTLGTHKWRALHVFSIPNPRLKEELAATALIERSESECEIGSIRMQIKKVGPSELDLTDLWDAARMRSYDAIVSPSEVEGCVDATFIDCTISNNALIGSHTRRQKKSPELLCNDPLSVIRLQALTRNLRGCVRERLPDYMLPSAWVIVNQMPLLRNGKIDRQALGRNTARPAEAGEFVAPVGALEKELAQIWADLLEIDQVGRSDNFFELGGHSLHATKLVAMIRERLQARIKVISVFQNPTISGLSRCIEEMQRSRTETVEVGMI